MIKQFFMKTALVFALPCFALPLLGMHNADDNKQPEILEGQLHCFVKYRISKENFDKAITVVAARPSGDYLAEQLVIKLHQFINQALSVNEWAEEVKKAYQEILNDSGPAELTLKENHPIKDILMATILAIPLCDGESYPSPSNLIFEFGNGTGECREIVLGETCDFTLSGFSKDLPSNEAIQRLTKPLGWLVGRWF